MAVAGGATTAYRVRMVSGKAKIDGTTAASYICAKPHEAIDAILDGDTVTVAGADMWELQQVLKAKGIGIAQQ